MVMTETSTGPYRFLPASVTSAPSPFWAPNISAASTVVQPELTEVCIRQRWRAGPWDNDIRQYLPVISAKYIFYIQIDFIHHLNSRGGVDD